MLIHFLHLTSHYFQDTGLLLNLEGRTWRCAVLQVPGGPCWTGARSSWLDSRRRRRPRPSLALCWSRVRPLFWVYCASAVTWSCWRRVCPRDHLWACECGDWQHGAEGTACHCRDLTSILTLSRQRKLFTSSFTLPQSKGSIWTTASDPTCSPVLTLLPCPLTGTQL